MFVSNREKAIRESVEEDRKSMKVKRIANTKVTGGFAQRKHDTRPSKCVVTKY